MLTRLCTSSFSSRLLPRQISHLSKGLSAFAAALKNANDKSFVYFDPPYDPISDSSSFTGYTKGGFGREQQESLKEVCDSLNKKNVKFMLSNSATDFIKDLYKDYTIHTVQAKRSVNSIASRRGLVDEVVVTNYE